jgi:hypothetical protein
MLGCEFNRTRLYVQLAKDIEARKADPSKEPVKESAKESVKDGRDRLQPTKKRALPPTKPATSGAKTSKAPILPQM